MKSIHRLRSRGHLTETQALTALRFWRSPNAFRLAPTLFRILREIVIDEVPLEEIEARRGWPARSAKAILAVILHAMEETDGLFWGEGTQDDARAILEYLHDLDGQELAELCERFALTPQQGRVMAALNRRFGEVVTHEALIRQVFAGTDEVSDAQAQIGTVMVPLRRKLRPAGLVIRLQRGVGYALEHAPGSGGLARAAERARDEARAEWRALRDRQGLSLREIARRTGHHASTIQRALQRPDPDAPPGPSAAAPGATDTEPGA